MAAAIEAVHVSDVPHLEQVSEINAALALIKAPWSAQGQKFESIKYLEFRNEMNGFGFCE